MRWANGGGWTSEIVAWPSPTNWEWRLSVADVEQAGPFSTFPDIDRTIALLEGNGFALTVGEHPTMSITERYSPFEFRGDDETMCALIDGPVQDLNLMVRRSTLTKRLEFAEVTTPSQLVGVDAVLVLSGHVRIDGHRLERFDALSLASVDSLEVTSVGDVPAVLALVR
jgi:uncharacterized protein